jgi:hypothetical protein
MSRKDRRKKTKKINVSLLIIALLIGVISASIFIFNSSLKGSIAVNTTSKNKIKAQIEPELADLDINGNKPEQGVEDKQSEIPPEEHSSVPQTKLNNPIKATEGYIDFIIENYLNIYINLANDSELEFYYLDNLVSKEGSFYRSLEVELEKLRQSDVKYVLGDFMIENIFKGKDDSELTVQVLQTINTKTTRYSYTIYFDKSGVFISDRK